MTNKDQPICFLFDNGSLRAASTLGLRRLAAALADALGIPVRAVSLLHSSGVPVSELEGRRAELLEPALLDFLAQGGTEAVLLPLFFGPSAALTDYVPERAAAILQKYPGRSLRLAEPLVDVTDATEGRIADMLADAVRTTISQGQMERAAVLLTDHGTPLRSVTAVRNHLGRQLASRLRNAGQIAEVGVASMERREGEDYAFNEPLLERALTCPPFDRGDVVIALQFLQPGRHAGPDGDIATICRAAEEGAGGALRTHMTAPIGTADPRLIGLLADRYRAALTTDSAVLSDRYPARNA